MRIWTTGALGLLLSFACHAAAPDAPPHADSKALYVAAHAALEARCANCHKVDVPEDAGRGTRKASKEWGGPGDMSGLQRFIKGAGHPIPDPDKTKLVRILNDPEEPMPPKKSRAGQLTKEEKAAIITWIRAGAIVPGAKVTPAGKGHDDDEDDDDDDHDDDDGGKEKEHHAH